MPLKYQTISADLTEYADLAAVRARTDGYRIKVEPQGAYFPVTPTIQGVARQREIIVEVVAKVSFKDARKWLAYAKAQDHETRVIVVAPPQKKNISVSEIENFQAAGIGLLVGNDGHLVQLVHSRDLSSEVMCPDVSGDNKKLQKKVAPCFDKVARGDVVDGFKDLAVIVEQAARNWLIQGVNSGRITFVSTSGKAITHKVADIRKGTMGWLRDRYSEIVKPNATDKTVLQAFQAVVPDRNVASHTELTAAKRRELHARIAKHLLVLLNAARRLYA